MHRNHGTRWAAVALVLTLSACMFEQGCITMAVVKGVQYLAKKKDSNKQQQQPVEQNPDKSAYQDGEYQGE